MSYNTLNTDLNNDSGLFTKYLCFGKIDESAFLYIFSARKSECGVWFCMEFWHDYSYQMSNFK